MYNPMIGDISLAASKAKGIMDIPVVKGVGAVPVQQQWMFENKSSFNDKPVVVDKPVQKVSKPTGLSEEAYIGGLIAKYGGIGEAIAANPRAVNVNNPRVREMLANEATYIQEQRPVNVPVESTVVEKVMEPVAGLASSGITGYSDSQVADMARVADLNRMQKNASYADAVGKLFGY